MANENREGQGTGSSRLQSFLSSFISSIGEVFGQADFEDSAMDLRAVDHHRQPIKVTGKFSANVFLGIFFFAVCLSGFLFPISIIKLFGTSFLPIG